MAASPHSNDWSSAKGAAGSAQSRLALSPQPLDSEAERRRRELDAAMEEELRQMVTKTSQRPSEPWSPAEPPPRESAARSRRLSLPWIMALIVVILALSGMAYQVLRKSETTERTSAANPAGLGLKVEMKKNTVQVSWDKNSPLIASAKRATLSIKDGQHQNDLTLGADLLSRGSLNYYHKTKDITFHLQVVADGNRTTSEVVQLPRDNQDGAPLPAPVSIDSGRQRVGTVPPEVPSTGKPVAFQGGFALAPQRLRKTAPQISPRAISVPPSEKREPAAIEKSPLHQATLKSTKPGVPQTWKLVVEYVGLTPAVSFQPEGTPNSSSLPMEGFSRAEDADALKAQAIAPPSDEPTPSHPKEMAKNAGVAEQTPRHDSAVRDSVVAPTQAEGKDSPFRSVVQCPENSKVREVPFVSGRPDRKTVGCGDAVAVIREFGDWVRIRTRDGFEGHILRQYVK
jgi:hypothetical protein